MLPPALSAACTNAAEFVAGIIVIKISSALHAYIVPGIADLPISLFKSRLVSLLSVDVHPDEPNVRIELFDQAASRPSLTRRLNPDRLDHKVDQLSRPVSPVCPNHPQAPQRSAPQLPLPRSHSRRQHESIPWTSRAWRLLERSRFLQAHPRSIISTTAPRAPDRQPAPFTSRSLARDSKGPLPRPVCRQSGRLPRTVVVCALAQAWTAILIPPEPSCPDPKYRRQ